MDMSDHIIQSFILISNHFKDDEKTAKWFKTPLKGLGYVTPVETMMLTPEKLYRFIKKELDEKKISL